MPGAERGTKMIPDQPPPDASLPRTIDLVAFGIVNAGKSSLLNALARRESRTTSPIGGTTTSVAVESWREGFAAVGPYAVRLIDTPGIEEVGDSARGPLALDAARRADVVLFVAAEDLTGTALAALRDLRAVGKPMLVAVNKMDLLDPGEGAEVLAAVRLRLDGLVPPEDVLGVSAAPLVRHRVEGPDGRPRTETARGAPEIGPLEARLLEAIAASAPDLKALADAAMQVDRRVAERDADRVDRRSRAERGADETSVGLALALAINPVPILDFLAGSGGVAVLVHRVANAYGEILSPEAARGLASELLRGGRIKLWGSLAAVGVGGLMKFLPGFGHLAGALTQATAAGTFGHILGRALVEYFENGHDWGDGGLIAALDRIAESTDRRALTRGLADRLKARLRGGRPG